MRNLKTYSVFESETQKLTQKQIKWLDQCTEGAWTLNPQTGLVDVKGDFDCGRQSLTSLQGVGFGVVTGYFYCGHNSLTSLGGAPLVVGKGFYCSDNSLTSLEGAPQEVGGDFDCFNNDITSLRGAPLVVGGDFDCSRNSLTSLEGAPQEMGRGFYCGDNPVPEGVLIECYELMESGKTYTQAVQEMWEGLDQDTKVLVYQPSFGWLSQEEHKKWAALQKFQRIKNMI
jgi:hypothetical protein